MVVDAALIASATLLGLAGTPHCAAMCGAPCAAVVGAAGGGTRPLLAFHAARTGAYALAGGIAAASIGALAAWSQWTPALRPAWTLVQAATLVLGLWLLLRGRQPAWMARLGRPPQTAEQGGSGPSWQRVSGPGRAAAAGALWVGWPCGLLQSALVVSAMASNAWGGAVAMAGFALASAPGLWLAPWAWQRLMRGAATPGAVLARERLLARAAGVMLVVGAGWALGHGLWHQVQAYCATM